MREVPTRAGVQKTRRTWPRTENLYIEGDNLEVLKLLQETYLGKIKMIYIDPPYNTGNDFVYNDEFGIRSEEWNGISGNYDADGNQIVGALEKNTEANGRFHTDWLNMMYPRLRLAKDILADNGLIFISIGQVELNNVTTMCDEIFGASNRAGIVSRQMKTGNNQGKFFTQNTDYIVVYSKNVEATSALKDDMSQDQMDKFYQDAQRAADAIFEREPFASLKSRFNVVAVAAPSLDEGPSIPHDGKWKNTMACSHYDTFYSNRYLTTSKIHRIYDALSNVPFEQIIVLVNSPTYGGGGIYTLIKAKSAIRRNANDRFWGNYFGGGGFW